MFSRTQNDPNQRMDNRMKHFSSAQFKVVTLAVVLALTGVMAMAQSQQMADKLMAIKQAQATNKQKLAQYTWQETETISIKGNVKDTKVYQVQIGPNGQPQKTEVNDQKAQSGGREGRVKEHVIEKKTEEYQQYGQQIGALAKQYTTPDPERLMQAKQAGNISLQMGGNGTVSLVIKNYVKQGDSVTMTINDQTHSPVSVEVDVVFERSQGRGNYLSPIRAVAGRDEPRRQHHHQRCEQTAHGKRAEFELSEDVKAEVRSRTAGG